MNAKETCPYRGIKNTLAMQDHLRSWKHIWLGIFIMMVCVPVCMCISASGNRLNFFAPQHRQSSLESPRRNGWCGFSDAVITSSFGSLFAGNGILTFVASRATEICNRARNSVATMLSRNIFTSSWILKGDTKMNRLVEEYFLDYLCILYIHLDCSLRATIFFLSAICTHIQYLLEILIASPPNLRSMK